MHFQINNDNYYDFLIKDLIKKIPEFHSVFNIDDEVYIILGEFGRFIINNINDEVVFMKAVEFVNYAIKNGKHKTEDAIVIQIFQPIYCNESLVNKMTPLLSSKSLIVFNKYKDLYNKI